MSQQTDAGGFLVVWDFSEGSVAALKQMMESAGDDTPVRAVYVSEPLEGPDNGALFVMAENRRVNKLQERFTKQLRDSGIEQEIPFTVEFGQVAREVARTADQKQSELIVVGLGQRSGIGRHPFAGISDRIARQTDCPVLVLKAASKSPQNKRLLGNWGLRGRSLATQS